MNSGNYGTTIFSWQIFLIFIHFTVDVVASGENTFRGFAVQSRASTNMFNGTAAFQGGFENRENDSDWQLIVCNTVSIQTHYISICIHVKCPCTQHIDIQVCTCLVVYMMLHTHKYVCTYAYAYIIMAGKILYI